MSAKEATLQPNYGYHTYQVMDKQVQKLKDEFGSLAEAINAFKSEAVQIRVIDWLLNAVDSDKPGNDKEEHSLFEQNLLPKVKRPGATKISNHILLTGFFDSPRSIAEIVNHGNNQFNTEIKASEVSGVLIQLLKNKRLKRERSENHRSFQYSQP
jgi:hypothetical protein